MRWLLCLFLIVSTQAHAWTHGNSGTVIPQGWNALAIVGGGYVTGIEIAADGTKIARSDAANGMWWWNSATSSWFTILNSQSNTDYSVNNFGGVDAMAIAPSNTSTAAMQTFTTTYVTTNLGTSLTWTALSNFPSTSFNANSVPVKWMGPRLAFDPVNPNILYASTPAAGPYKCVNSSGWASATCTSISAIPGGGAVTGGSGENGGNEIVFDNTSSGCTTPVASVSQCIYISSYGTGWYRSTNGGSGWTQISGSAVGSVGPDTMYGASLANQKLWATGNDCVEQGVNPCSQGFGGFIWVYTPGSGWVKDPGSLGIATGTAWVAVDPANANQIVACNLGGYCATSTNGAGAWNTFAACTGPGAGNVTSTEAGWQSTGCNNGTGLGSAKFDPTQSTGATSDVMYMSVGWSLLKGTPLASNTSLAWTTQAKGIENVISSNVRWLGGGQVMTLQEDLAGFAITPGSAPTISLPFNRGLAQGPLDQGQSADYSASNNSIVCVVFISHSGCSTSGGNGTFTDFSSAPPNDFGQILVVDNSDLIWSQENEPPYYSSSLTGATWTQATNGSSNFSDTPCIGVNLCHVMSKCPSGKLELFMTTSAVVTEHPGIFTSSDKGHSWIWVSSSTDPSTRGGAIGMTLICVNDNLQYYTPGYHISGQPDTSIGLYSTTNGGVSWTVRDPRWSAVLAVASGAACVGHTNPALFVSGWFDASSGGGTTNAEYGVWQTCDPEDQNSAIYTQLGSTSCSTPNNCNIPLYLWPPLAALDGDPNTPGRVAAAFLGGGGYAFFQP